MRNVKVILSALLFTVMATALMAQVKFENRTVKETYDCKECNNTGKINDCGDVMKCPNCSGKGKLTFDVPVTYIIGASGEMQIPYFYQVFYEKDFILITPRIALKNVKGFMLDKENFLLYQPGIFYDKKTGTATFKYYFELFNEKDVCPTRVIAAFNSIKDVGTYDVELYKSEYVDKEKTIVRESFFITVSTKHAFRYLEEFNIKSTWKKDMYGKTSTGFRNMTREMITFYKFILKNQ